MSAVEGWTSVTVTQCCDILDSKRVPVNAEDRDRRVGEIPYYGANGLQGYIDDFIFDEPLILIAEDGGCFDEFATRPIAYRVKGKSWVNNHAHVLRAKEGFCQDAIFYTLEHKDIQPFIVGGTRAKLNQSALRSIVVELPTSKSEQSKIAEILSMVDLAIEQTESLIAKQQRIKTGLMQDLLTRGIDEHGNLRSEQTHKFKDSPLGRIPVEWKVGGFDNYVVSDAGIKPGPFGSNLTKDMHVQLGYRVYGQEQVIGGSLDLGDYYITGKKYAEMAALSVRAGDVLISLVGTIGHVLVVPERHHPGVINPRLLRFRPDPKRCIPEFLKALLLSQQLRLQLETFATGGTMSVLSAGIIRKLSIVIIGAAEQKKIIEVLGRSERCLLSHTERLHKLHSLKTALMQDLLTGKKRVTSLLNSTLSTN